jgi:DMSO/TMAO reductase YedYZ molybdopterin-dependent catalytic subunit
MPQHRLLLSLTIVLALCWASAAPAADDAPAVSAITVTGAVEHEGDVSIDELRKLPTTAETVFFHTGHGGTMGSFTGATLWSLLQKVGLRTDPAVRNELLHKYIVAVGSDGYYAVLALAEIHPEFGGDQVIVAYEQDGKPLGDGGARLIVPGDKGGGRNVMKLKSIAVRDAAP